MLAWFKVDDGFHSSRKVLSIPRRTRLAAIGAWALAGAWCADELTDGHVPDYMISEWGFPKSVVDALVDSGLWERERGGLAFRNWAEYQPSKADVDAERAASRDRMRELRAKRKQKKPQDDAEVGEVFGRTGANGSENVRNPDPTRPDPTRPTTSEDKSSSVVGALPARTCGKHDGWEHDERCGACGRDRRAHEAYVAEQAKTAAAERREAQRNPTCPHGFPRHEACDRCGPAWPGRGRHDG